MPYLRCKNVVLEAEEDECHDYWDFLSVDSVVTVASDSGSQDPFWLIRIIENNCIANSEDPDSYGNKIIPGQQNLKGYFSERMHSDKNFILYNIDSYVTFYCSLNYSFLILF